MPYYFVEGYRDGKPTPALYIKADNPDAAVARAAQLQMQEVTSVRMAKSPPPQGPLDMIDKFSLVLFALILVMDYCDAGSTGRSFGRMAVPFLLTLIPAIFRVNSFLIKTQQEQAKMQAEIDELRDQLRSRVPSIDEVSSGE